jgi:hypothetical protein
MTPADQPDVLEKLPDLPGEPSPSGLLAHLAHRDAECIRLSPAPSAATR